MEFLGLTKGLEVVSTLPEALFLKRAQAPDEKLLTKIFQEFNKKTKNYWSFASFYLGGFTSISFQMTSKKM